MNNKKHVFSFCLSFIHFFNKSWVLSTITCISAPSQPRKHTNYLQAIVCFSGTVILHPIRAIIWIVASWLLYKNNSWSLWVKQIVFFWHFFGRKHSISVPYNAWAFLKRVSLGGGDENLVEFNEDNLSQWNLAVYYVLQTVHIWSSTIVNDDIIIACFFCVLYQPL